MGESGDGSTSGVRVLSDACWNQLKCNRCYKYTHDVGKIKQWPDVCMRCADAMQYMTGEGIGPDGQPKDWTEWMQKHEDYHAKNPLRQMETTHKIGDFDVVYMPEEQFIAMYNDKIKFLRGAS